MPSQFWKKIISNLEFNIQANYQSSVTSTVARNNLPPTHHLKKVLEDMLPQKQGVNQERGHSKEKIYTIPEKE